MQRNFIDTLSISLFYSLSFRIPSAPGTAQEDNPKQTTMKNMMMLQYINILVRKGLPLLASLCLAIPFSAFGQEALEVDEDEIEELEAFTVRPIAAGALAALEEQKNAVTISTIVSEETMDNLPDQSIGEALSRLAGVGIQKDRGEAERIFIRGTDARLNAVTINGDRLPSPESTVAAEGIRGDRSVRLNTIPATLISGIEIFKSVPPSMDADSIGGAVELRTKSATELDNPILDTRVRVGYNDLSQKGRYSGEITYGTRFGNEGQFGIIATASYEENNTAVKNIDIDWSSTDELLDLATGDDVDLDSDHFIIGDYNVMWRDLKRTRMGGNITLDWKPNETSLFKVGAFVSQFNDEELRRRAQIRFGSGSDYTTDTTFDDNNVVVEGYVDGGRIRRRVRPGEKVQKTYNLFFEGTHDINQGIWELDYRISQSWANRSLNRTRTRWEARSQDLGFRGDGIADLRILNGNEDIVFYEQLQFWLNDPDALHVGRRGDYRIRNEDLSEAKENTALVNLARTFELDAGTLKVSAGYKGRFGDRDQLNGNFDFEIDQDDAIFMRDFLGADEFAPARPYGVDHGRFGDQALVDAYLAQNSSILEPDGDTLDEDYFVKEDIHAGYLQADWTSGPWGVIAGVRYEKTTTDITARDGQNEYSYDDFFPALILRYEASPNLIFRGAATTSIGRPDYYDLRPFFSSEFEYEQEDDTDPNSPFIGSLFAEGGNPELEPFKGVNYDLGFEYYLPQGGVIALGAFYKEIENFEYTEEIRLENVAISDLPPYLQDVARDAIADNPNAPPDIATLDRFNYIRPVNGDKAKLTGLEANYQQKFTFLPGFLSDFGFLGNYTRVWGDSQIDENISRDYVIGQFDYVGNAQLFWESDTMSARLAYNFNGINYEILGLNVDDGQTVSDTQNDSGRDETQTLDFAYQWRLPYFGDDRPVTLTFDIQNVLDNNSTRRMQGGPDDVRLFRELEGIGRSYILGIRWEL